MKEGKEMDWFVFYVWNDAVIVNWVFYLPQEEECAKKVSSLDL